MKQILIILISALLLAGCTPEVAFTKVDKDKFSMEVPADWKEQTPQTDVGELVYYSDKDGQSFYEGAVGVYLHETEGYAEIAFDQAYCDEMFDVFAEVFADSNFSQVDKRQVTFVSKSESKPAHCDIEYGLLSSDGQQSTFHREYQYVVDNSIISVEASYIDEQIPAAIQHALNSFSLKI